MGRRSTTGGVAPKGADRIEFTFVYDGKRVRPTLEITPSEANLRRARVRLADIKQRIANKTFVFADEFPEYRNLDAVSTPAEISAARERAGQTQTEAGAVIHGSLRAWQDYEGGTRRMHPGLFELYQIKTGQSRKYGPKGKEIES